MKRVNNRLTACFLLIILMSAFTLTACTGSPTIAETIPTPTAIAATATAYQPNDYNIADIKDYLPDKSNRIETTHIGSSVDESNRYLTEQYSGWVYSYINHADLITTTYGEFIEKFTNNSFTVRNNQMLFTAENGQHYLIIQAIDFNNPDLGDNPIFYIAEVTKGVSDEMIDLSLYFGSSLGYHIDLNHINPDETPMIMFESIDLAYTFSVLYRSTKPQTPPVKDITLLSYYLQGVIEGDITIDDIKNGMNMWYREETDALYSYGFGYGYHSYYFEIRAGNDDENRSIDYSIDELILVHSFAYQDKVIINPTVEEMIAFFNGEIEGEPHERYDG